VPVVAREHDLTRVNGLVETARYTGMTLGPFAGGVLAGLGGTDIAMLVNAGTFGVVAAAALVLHARRAPQAIPEGGTEERARDGIAYLFRDRTPAIAMSVLFVTLLFMTASVTAEVFFLKEDLEVSDAVYGVLFGAWTGGMIFGALVIARRVPRHLLALGVLIATLVQGAGLGLPTAWLVATFSGAMWFVGGTGHGTKNTLAARSSRSACRTACTGGRSPPTTRCETGPSSSPWRAAACWWRPSAAAPPSRSPAASPWRWRSSGSSSTAARQRRESPSRSSRADQGTTPPTRAALSSRPTSSTAGSRKAGGAFRPRSPAATASA
jgi:MFS family permease